MTSASCFFLIVAFCASFSFIQCQNYNKFKDKHIVEDQAQINCNITIKDRQINKDSCRFRNTFIHDTNGRKIRELCSPYVRSTLVPSDSALALTDCKLLKSRSSSPSSGCSYNQTEVKGVVYVTCENQLPVHFERFELSFAVHCTPCLWTLSLFILFRYLF
ncbi:hypothetical protein GDO81_001922 [Engystomops pustulosus]|uniref:Ribonuclease A-domain domain-containing protein n=1 Tax=Engystomops pustulosus TaxID=76066 RepID=A0AAV7DG68_ENGPU|nr:hypothetical protein GDO81_001922 [Engystomops pustulosus]